MAQSYGLLHHRLNSELVGTTEVSNGVLEQLLNYLFIYTENEIASISMRNVASAPLLHFSLKLTLYNTAAKITHYKRRGEFSLYINININY